MKFDLGHTDNCERNMCKAHNGRHENRCYSQPKEELFKVIINYGENETYESCVIL